MSLIDKIKSGVSEAGHKAKIVVEVNKLRIINVSKQSEINSLYKQIGEKVSQFVDQNISLEPSLFASELEQIDILKFEIEQNILQIHNLNDEKSCPHCHHDNAFDARECAQCHAPFPIHDIPNIEISNNSAELIDPNNKLDKKE
ncbi:zinc ribbon domain-containing protein [Paenibacillus endoradicis]|uniref:zinc ribbon domain-containing protein n=1 Tax=Paenibacillus endoradicis TaxID=2972487 RepID=UPI002159A08B|nr:zinc ribbon domain-containing protein [Paenibacillus endoradicis]MCR8655818.1 zinc ribbon domain-containing protein [Paenibacillus endoradicis]MCR8658144.1 zinc ribbon domain-containing protein [Paenibacillus endoradicis]